jgi:hypothetical protein
MHLTKTTWFVFACVLVVMTLSVTAFKYAPSSAQSDQSRVRPGKQLSHEELVKRYPIAEFDDPEPADPTQRAALRLRKLRNNEHTFSEPSHEDEAVGWFPEKNFDFPALPINESEVILVGQVLDARAHRSENKRGVFSEFDVSVDEVLKGKSFTANEPKVIVVERTGGFLRYPNGRRVLFFVQGQGMPNVGTRNVFFLKVVNQGFQIVTVYELGPDGVLPLDLSNQFKRFQGEKGSVFLNTLREAITNTRSQ